MDNKDIYLTTDNHEARKLITESRHLWRRVLDMELGLPKGTDMPAEGKEILEESIRLAWQVLEVDPDSPDLYFYYMTLAEATNLMYFITGELDAGALDEAIHFSTLALNAIPDEKPEFRARLLYDLGVFLYNRYECQSSPSDLEEAIQAIRQATETTEDISERFRCLEQLVAFLVERYTKTGTSHDLEEVIRADRQAIEATEDNWKRIPFLQNLTRLLEERYKKLGASHNLDEAIVAGKRAVVLMSDTSDETQYMQFGSEANLRKISMLQYLAKLLIDRYNKTGASGDAGDAVLFGKQAVALMPDTPNKTRLLTAISLQSGIGFPDPSSADIEGALALLDQIINLTVDGLDETDLAISVAMNVRGKPGNMKEVEKHIVFLERHIEKIRIKGDPAKHSLILSTLAERLFAKYMMTGRVVDLDRGITLAEEAVDKMAGHEHENKEFYLLCLATLSEGFLFSSCTIFRLGHDALDNLTMKSERLSHPEKAVMYMRKCIDVSPNNDRLRETLSTMLAIQLRIKDSLKRDIVGNDVTALEEKIHVAREELFAASDDHPNEFSSLLQSTQFLGFEGLDLQPDWRMFSSILASRLETKYLLTGQAAALDEAIQLLERVVDSHGNSNADHGLSRVNLFFGLLMRFFHTKAKADLENASTYARTVFYDAESFPLSRILALHLLIIAPSSMNREDMEKLYQDAVLGVSLIPKLLSRSFENSDSAHFMLPAAVGVASDAAALALETGKDPLVAVELLESGRGVLAATLENLRADVPDLQARYPILADRFARLQKELSIPASPKWTLSLFSQGFGNDIDLGYGVGVDRRCLAGKEFYALVDKIRQLPGFESALGSPSRAEILEVARDGPIAIINVSRVRCDAVLVERDRVWNLPLPRLSWVDITKKAESSDLGHSDILEWMWDAITCPILHALGFDQHLTDNHLSRIWWIPTGSLNGFALHAAGYHRKRNFETVIDRVMSSYSPSIKAIINSRRRRMNSSLAPGQALLVAMPQTPGYSVLRHSIEEVSKVRDICNSMSLKPIDLQMPDKQDVLRSLLDCKVFHFAGHADADASYPSNSRLYLHDWKDNPLRVSDILGLDLRVQAPFLAYLSACGTGRIKDKFYVDESTHLISAFKLAGFRHVIGTLWDADDEGSIDMARIVYEGMRDGGLTDESVCRGLHNASRALRDRWISKSGPGDRENEGREKASEHSEKPVANGKGSEETPIESPPFKNEFGVGWSDSTEEDFETRWKNLMEDRKRWMKDELRWGMVKYSGPSQQVRTVSRGGSGLDSAVPSSSPSVIDAKEALSTARELRGSLQASIDALDVLDLSDRLTGSLRKIQLDEADNGESGANRQASPLWIPYVHFGV